MPARRHIAVAPSAARLTGSLRDIGYDFPSAIADLVDNSVAAGATRVDIEIEFAGTESRVLIADDGRGMSANGVEEALRFGSRRDYQRGDLGRYGLGLKTASLSQGRVVTVASRRVGGPRTSIRQLDLGVIEEFDQWLVVSPDSTSTVRRCRELLDLGFNTVVAWEELDRVLPQGRPDGGWARRRFESMTRKTAQHLSMVFHRFLEAAVGDQGLVIVVNGEKLRPWNPFAPEEEGTRALGEQTFEMTVGDATGLVRLERYVLPHREAFSSQAEFERMSGPLKWNRQQGVYIYRAGRLVQWGGWAGIRAIDEHTKLARAALHFDTDLDPAFNINVAKMRVSVPPQIRQMLERPIHEVCMAADEAYRRQAKKRPAAADAAASDQGIGVAAATAGLALRSAALQTGDYEALQRIAAVLGSHAPELLLALGLSEL